VSRRNLLDLTGVSSASRHNHPNRHSNGDPNPNADPKRRHIVRDEANPNRGRPNLDPNPHSNGEDPNLGLPNLVHPNLGLPSLVHPNRGQLAHPNLGHRHRR
jgi:hypothetical protein